ncbi:trypsin-like serine protease [uncultured Tateyamaria sp.]|uniref:trypsin-like serine peptidase n=1 Tax=uncultured Tateyamaria sp. TaxID=455651 RepID=UPI0026292317|nr:trypsin-like serine protease [uncultured Tateyamaria sp.]
MPEAIAFTAQFKGVRWQTALGMAACLSIATAFPAIAQDQDNPHNPLSSDGVSVAEIMGPFNAEPGNEGDPGKTTGTQGESIPTESAEDFFDLLELEPAVADPIEDEIGIRSIFRPDTRKRNKTTTYPERTSVLVTYNNKRCSGAMISKDTVLTAGHCVHGGGSAGSWSQNVRVYPGRDGPSSPFGSCRARSLHSVTGWVRNRDERYDYGAIKLDCTVGERTGWLGFFWQTASLVGLPTIIDGYPGDKNLTQWRSTDQLRANDTRQVFYRNDTVPGNSGSAVYTTASSVCRGPCALGVHSMGVHGGGVHASNNHGVRITKAVFENLKRWTQ